MAIVTLAADIDCITLASALSGLVRDEGHEPDAYLDTIEVETSVDGTRTLVRWHRIAHDATCDKPDVEKLVSKLFRLLIDFSCSRKELAEASEVYERTRSGQAFAGLQEKARRLFTSSSTTGEVGELLLYYLAEHLLKYPQVLCKYPLKTNPNIHAHGADGIHASVDPATGHLRLHWGEAKLHQRLNKALDDCFSSLCDLTLEPSTAKKTKTRDIELLRDYIALDDPGLEQSIRSYLDPDDVLSNKIRFCGLALVGFDLSDYAKLSVEIANQQVDAIRARTLAWSVKVKEAVEKYELVSVTIDIFCIPFPSVQAFRDAFLRHLGVSNAN